MLLNQVLAGKEAPEDIFVVIEISEGALPVKYEMDKESGALMVDRFMLTPMFYPANYGFIPQTLGDDGDPLDVLVITPQPIMAGSIIHSRPIGVLKMEDESGMDEKIIAVPQEKLYPPYGSIKELSDLPEIKREAIRHFFEHYKDLEKGKWVKISGWGSAKEAKEIIQKGIAAHG